MAIGKTELAQQVAEQAGLSRSQANKAVDAVLDSITTALQKDDEVRLTGFGSFKVTQTKARTGRNPRTGETLNIAAGKRPTFTAGSRLKQSVGGK
ncbi:MAG TPA: HU family DNA-binding protein [Chloroflexota bacterium]|jgi:nucleoid DNA-binding protein